jgi:hypothetical protein
LLVVGGGIEVIVVAEEDVVVRGGGGRLAVGAKYSSTAKHDYVPDTVWHDVAMVVWQLPRLLGF